MSNSKESEWVRIEGKTIEELNNKFPKLKINEVMTSTLVKFDIDKDIYFSEYHITHGTTLDVLEILKIGIHEIKEELQHIHDSDNFSRDHEKWRGDTLAYTLLGKMKELGLISEYTLLFRDEKGIYKIRFYNDNKQEKVRIDE